MRDRTTLRGNARDARLLYSSSDMAALCGISVRTWQKWVQNNIAPQPIYINEGARWLAGDIDAWLKRVKSTRDERWRKAFSRL